MVEDGAVQLDAVREALAYEIWEVNGCVDADRSEGCAGVDARLELFLRDDSEVGDDDVEPGIRAGELIEPDSSGGCGVFGACQAHCVWESQ